MSVPYECTPRVVEVAAGQATTIEVPFPSRSFISKVIVQRVDGSGEFDVDLFNHRSALEGTPASLSATDPNTSIALPEELFKLCPTFHSASGLVEFFSEFATGGHGLLFYSQDKPQPGERTIGNRRVVYLRITPTSGGGGKFAYVIGGEQAID